MTKYVGIIMVFLDYIYKVDRRRVMSVSTDQIPHPNYEDMDLQEALRLIDEYFDLLDTGNKRGLNGIDIQFRRAMRRSMS